MKTLWSGLLFAACTSVVLGATTMGPGMPHIPTGAVLEKLVNESFKNVDSDKDGLIEPYEFDTLIIVADSDDNGCMTLDEYKKFSAGTPEIATKIYKHFDPDNSDCLTVDKVFGEFAAMDVNHNNKVTPQEFKQYYINLLTLLFGQQQQTVG
ncbi:uncharacterized protein LOC123554594 isoform X2 [Mercenaria mercenaria]|uniref:uncharacterized protein LOC123554594 isoform X2 n=1 Tax=Mercenaria mercenaria TaxID=6596 RepID=UPI001E1DEBDE|nr:uncharacterized protein LOC123554594 isoform X2 [Mercenaria mercenaria]